MSQARWLLPLLAFGASLLLAQAPQSPAADLLGGWESRDCGFRRDGGCPPAFVEYRRDGTVHIVEGNLGGVKRTYDCLYQFEERRLLVLCPAAEPQSYAYRLKGESLELQRILDEPVGAEDPWKVRYVRQAKPGPELESMPEMPRTLPQVFEALRLRLDAKFLDSVRRQAEPEFRTGSHFGLGLWLRNSYGLWGGYDLAQSFERIGVLHADDMSGLILTTLWRLVHHRPIELEEQVRASIEGFLKEEIGRDEPSSTPGPPAWMAFFRMTPLPLEQAAPDKPEDSGEEPTESTNERKTRWRFLGLDRRDGTAWAFERESGLSEASDEEALALRKQLEEMRRLNLEISAIRFD